jgi:transcription termination factor NusB
MITVTVAKADADLYILHDELLAALGTTYQGMEVTATTVKVFLADAATTEDEETAEETVDNHPVLEESIAGNQATAIADAVAALQAEDFAAMRTALDASTTVAELIVVLRDILRGAYYAAAAQGFTDDDPGGQPP